MKDGKFEVGDIITAYNNSRYPITSDSAIMIVKRVIYNNIYVRILFTTNARHLHWVHSDWIVDNSNQYFRLLF